MSEPRYGFVGVLLPAAILAVLTNLLMRLRRPSGRNGRWPILPESAEFGGRVVFWTAAFVFGVFGTSVYNRIAGPFVFTWPVCLFVAHQLTLNAVVRSNAEPRPRGSRWIPALAVTCFVAVCVLYFLVCRRLNHAVQWMFLFGFFPSWAVAVPGAYRMHSPGPLLRDVLWAAASFTLFYWSGAVAIWLKMSL